jgi:hypothetical protein
LFARRLSVSRFVALASHYFFLSVR